MSRFSFKKNVEYDLALLRETESINPFSLPIRKSIKLWRKIAANLEQSNLKMNVTERSCRERIQQLLTDFKIDESLSQNASGIAEDEMTELTKLLTSVTEQQNKQAKAVKISTPTNSKIKAEDTRSRALEEIELTSTAEDEVEIDEDNSDVLNDEGSPTIPTQKKMKLDKPEKPSPDRKTGKTQKVELINYLTQKSKNELEFKTKELEVRAAEAENKKIELELQRDRQKAEAAEKTRITDLLLKLVEQSATKN